MTKPKTTKPVQHNHTCAKCGNPFKSPKVWARFCSTQCRVNAHQAERYTDSKKAARAVPRLQATVASLKSVLADVEMFIEHDKSDEGRDLLRAVRAAVHGKRAVAAE